MRYEIWLKSAWGSSRGEALEICGTRDVAILKAEKYSKSMGNQFAVIRRDRSQVECYGVAHAGAFRWSPDFKKGCAHCHGCGDTICPKCRGGGWSPSK